MASTDTRMTWDHKADHDLLTAMTQEFQPSQEQLRSVMARMHSFGYTCTVKAITQHLQKLRRKEGSGPAAKSDGGEGSSTPKSAKKRPAPASGKKTASAKKAAAAKLSDPQDDSEPDMESPSKRVKTEKARKGKGVKKEESGDEQPVKKEEQDDDENVGPAV
ncbi:hypothetical protein B0H67DRAFT_649487 [Lasiosphaeris hirsuta]|uniref:Uncharacterized protein n=1 Tax=Lasiosphaeris hirsuta TaxID=260670 RepID=A0AA39ZWW7_9PEZI|nr:hypothetical protein B0H67DRAFT_649487 [Lasiosphaeris hirsuta]